MPDCPWIERMETLGRKGLVVSVVFGPSGPHAYRWTVQVLSREGDEFAEPFAARSFEHAILIAEREATARGWLPA